MTESQDVIDELNEGFKTLRISSYMCHGVYAYVIQHQRTGQFLQAVIQNNLLDAVCRADSENLFVIRGWVKLFHNFTPSLCHGSKEKYDAWVKVT